jgi:outer membrane protein OmpA-like peptidoglycan-associated protein
LLAGGAFGVDDRSPAAGAARPAPPPAPPPPQRQANGPAPQLLAGGAFSAGAPPPPPQGGGPITGSPAPRPPVATAPVGSNVVPPAPPPGQQIAAAPAQPSGSAAEGPMLLRVGFAAGEEVLTPAAQSQLAQLAKRLAGNDERINVKAYAAEGKDGTAARRLSLSRALAVRRFLGDQNVAVARINVTALGAPGDSGPADRVDIVSIGR